MEIKIEKMAFAGAGIGNLPNGKKIFIKKVVPGDIVEIEITDEKSDFAFGLAEKVIESSPDRIKPKCEYFYQCGGCDHQNISYKNQLKIKQKLVEESLQRQRIENQVLPIIPASNKEFYYRNSIRFMFFLDKKNQLHTAHNQNSNNLKLVVVDKCLLQSEKSNLILSKLLNCINKNVANKETFWQLKIREGKQTGDVMVEIITPNNDLPGEEEIVKTLKTINGIKSIYHTITPGKSLLNLRRRLIFGFPVIYEKIGSFTFQISPESFFQTNSFGVKNLYDTIKQIANIKMGENLLDLYCGTGSIGIYLSTLAKKVVGVDVVPEAIRDAKDNAKINKIQNAEFICLDANKLDIFKYKNFVIIVDPPRAGLKKELIPEIAKLDFKRLIYISCNQATFARDLKEFEKRGVIAKKIQPIDMFPQTHHIECVCLLEKANN
ncbi:23S rRNA (uracil(1939)-C(5))-methyltransferase RlmD [Candidatus Berkelbacteria bacterium CG08_land_8_20_14_0_20_39_8]|uniref:23S rRNA (Uracil(1939)-C(5))-methyltransferase RlmD n=1 Tax=Candidatus Berkelbacteria bacterium CG08_land_8_20_14_0_20_39_8 TaxID=1974511 RepID=A0A2M6YCU7_9BACT|nr:MAG: 23S rRNA (uracil(1939)-C(5))-methyltransferase RlmD [Candidatus Berkelbacteria bacterium CG08_land_8_20_14_0_20_39_8]